MTWQIYHLNITVLFPKKDMDYTQKLKQIEEQIKNKIAIKDKKKAEIEDEDQTEEFFQLKFKELTYRGNATFVFSENMKDEMNGFNLT